MFSLILRNVKPDNLFCQKTDIFRFSLTNTIKVHLPLISRTFQLFHSHSQANIIKHQMILPSSDNQPKEVTLMFNLKTTSLVVCQQSVLRGIKVFHVFVHIKWICVAMSFIQPYVVFKSYHKPNTGPFHINVRHLCSKTDMQSHTKIYIHMYVHMIYSILSMGVFYTHGFTHIYTHAHTTKTYTWVCVCK